jgi:hypothetical protein
VDSGRRFDRHRHPILVVGAADPDLVGQVDRRQQQDRNDPLYSQEPHGGSSDMFAMLRQSPFALDQATAFGNKLRVRDGDVVT